MRENIRSGSALRDYIVPAPEWTQGFGIVSRAQNYLSGSNVNIKTMNMCHL